MIQRLLHYLGIHGPNWYCAWHMGDVWAECALCGRRYKISYDNVTDIPDDQIEAHFR